MSSFISGVNPLSYMGVRPVAPPPVYYDDRAPTEYDLKNFTLSTIWIDRQAHEAYMLVANANSEAVWIRLGGVNEDIYQITTPDTNIVKPVNGNVNFLNGTGISITGSGEDVTFSATSTPFKIQWNVITNSTEQLVVYEGYFANNPTGVTFTLPASAAVGDYICVVAMDAGGWVIEQNAGQTIRLGAVSTTVGVTGSVSSTKIGDYLALICSVADTEFIRIGLGGNLDYT